MSNEELINQDSQTVLDERLEGFKPDNFTHEALNDYSENGMRLRDELSWLFKSHELPDYIIKPEAKLIPGQGWEHLGIYAEETLNQIAGIAAQCYRDQQSGDIVVTDKARLLSEKAVTPFILHKKATQNLGLDKNPFAAKTNDLNAELIRLEKEGLADDQKETVINFAKQSFSTIEKYYLDPEEEAPDYTYNAPPLPSDDSPEYKYYQIAVKFMDEKLAAHTWDLVRDYIGHYLKYKDPDRSSVNDYFAQSECIGRMIQRIRGKQQGEQYAVKTFLEFHQIVNTINDDKKKNTDDIFEQIEADATKQEDRKQQKKLMEKKIIDSGKTTDPLIAKAQVNQLYQLIDAIELIISAAEALFYAEKGRK